MGKPEAHVEQYLYRQIKKLGGMCLKFTSGITGVPDRIVILDGKTVFIEAKAPGKDPTKLQLFRMSQMRAAGAHVRVIDTRAQVDELISDLVGQDDHLLEKAS